MFTLAEVGFRDLIPSIYLSLSSQWSHNSLTHALLPEQHFHTLIRSNLRSSIHINRPPLPFLKLNNISQQDSCQNNLNLITTEESSGTRVYSTSKRQGIFTCRYELVIIGVFGEGAEIAETEGLELEGKPVEGGLWLIPMLDMAMQVPLGM